MRERTTPYETIKNPSGETLATVLITSSDKLVHNLMGDHYIQLDFTLDSAIHFPVGSYVDDAVFGRFFITEDQMPTYDTATGGYKYELKFEAWYKLWNNKQLMLTNIGTTFRTRTEANWSLTKDLEGQALEIIHNLQCLGFVHRNITSKSTSKYTNKIACYRTTDSNGKYSLQFISTYDTNIGICIRVRYYSTYTDDEGNEAHDEYLENNFIFPNQNCSMPSNSDGYADYNGGDYEIVGVYVFTGAIDDSDSPEDVKIKYLDDSNTISQEYWYYQPSVPSRGLTFEYVNVAYEVLGQMYQGITAAKTALDVKFPTDNQVASKAVFYTSSSDGLSGYFNMGYPFRNLTYYCPSGYIYMWCGKSDAADYTDGVMMYRQITDSLMGMTVYNPNSLSLSDCTLFYVMQVSVMTIETSTYAYPKDLTFANFKKQATALNGTHGDSTIISLASTSDISFTVAKNTNITSRTDLVENEVSSYRTSRKNSISYEKISCEDFSGSYSDSQLISDFISIDSANIDKYKEALTMSYNGTKIIDALNNIANTFECEWWIDYDIDESKKFPISGTAYPAFKICFGKLETGTEQALSLNTNVESMTINRDSSTPATKLYCFGSTDNIPYSYRKSIYVNINKIDSTYYCLQMTGITKGYKGLIDPAWFGAESATESTSVSLKAQSSTVSKQNMSNNGTYAYKVLQSCGNIHLTSGNYQFNSISSVIATVKFIINTDKTWSTFNRDAVKEWDEETQSYVMTNQDYIHVSLGFFLKGIDGKITPMIYSREYMEGTYKAYNDAAGMTLKASHTNEKTYNDIQYISSGNYELFFGIVVGCYCQTQDWLEKAVIQNLNITANSVSITASSLSINGEDADTGGVDILYNNTKYTLTLNPNKATKPSIKSPSSEYFQCKLADGTTPFSGGELVKIISKTDNINIPTMYFTNEYENPSALCQIGDRRLMLPENTDPEDVNNWDNPSNPMYVCLNGAIIPYKYRNTPDAYDLIETSVAFDKEYPNGKLQITNICTTDEDTKTEAEGEAEMYSWKWLQYHLNLATAEGASLVFDKQYILDGYTLGLRFLTPADITAYGITPAITIDTANGCKLCGMQFEMEFNDSIDYKESGSDTYTTHTQDYAIVRNEDFGAKLPSEILHPTVGDPVCLINWDVRALNSLGLIDAAERNLRTKAFEYAQALQEGNFTFTCNMFSAFMFDLYGEYISLGDVNDNNLVESGGAYLYVKNGFDVYAIPQLGQKVCINHDALSESKHTRVIGYEYKLDKPYDSPKLTCGETEAYSRLKQMEKEITKLS